MPVCPVCKKLTDFIQTTMTHFQCKSCRTEYLNDYFFTLPLVAEAKEIESSPTLLGINSQSESYSITKGASRQDIAIEVSSLEEKANNQNFVRYTNKEEEPTTKPQASDFSERNEDGFLKPVQVIVPQNLQYRFTKVIPGSEEYIGMPSQDCKEPFVASAFAIAQWYLMNSTCTQIRGIITSPILVMNLLNLPRKELEKLIPSSVGNRQIKRYHTFAKTSKLFKYLLSPEQVEALPTWCRLAESSTEYFDMIAILGYIENYLGVKNFYLVQYMPWGSKKNHLVRLKFL